MIDVCGFNFSFLLFISSSSAFSFFFIPVTSPLFLFFSFFPHPFCYLTLNGCVCIAQSFGNQMTSHASLLSCILYHRSLPDSSLHSLSFQLHHKLLPEPFHWGGMFPEDKLFAWVSRTYSLLETLPLQSCYGSSHLQCIHLPKYMLYPSAFNSLSAHQDK